MTGITSVREVARRVGLSHTAIQNAERAGRIGREPDGTWDLESVRRRLVAAAARQPLAEVPATPARAAMVDEAPVAETGCIASTRELGRRLGVSHTSLQKAERAGRIAREPNGRWDLEKVRAGLATRAAPKPRKPYGPRAPWARAAHHLAKLDADIVGPARGIHRELEAARQALERAARQIAALYPEILRLERACDAAIAAQQREGT